MSKSPSPLVLRLQAGLAPRPLAQALRRVQRQTACGRRALAFYLHDMQDRGVHQALGFASAVHFAVERLEMKRRTARDLIAVGRALAELPLIDRAFAEGRISWTKLRLLARICVPETQSAWLAEAEALALSAFERRVATSEVGRPPREGGHGLPVTRIDMRLRFNVVEHEMLEQVRQKFSAETGEEVTPRQLVLALAERYLAKPSEARGGERTDVAGESLYRVHVDHCPECRSSQVRTLDGPVPIPASQGEALLCEADRSSCAHGAAAPPEEAPAPAGRALRRKILSRDGHRCRACSTKAGGLQVHHIRWRSRGGRTVPENLTVLCARCHALVHEGLLTIEGTAPHHLTLRRSSDGANEPDDTAVSLVMEPPIRGAAAPSATPTALTFATLPDEVNGTWWRRHHHRLHWNDRRGVFQLQDGAPADDAVARPRHGTPPDAPRFSDVIGQQRVVASLELALEAARIEDRLPDPILLTGPAGGGKTTLARAIASRLERRSVDVSAPTMEHPAALLGLVAGLREGDVLFIDEVHALPRRVAEMLYEALQERTLTLPVAQGGMTKTVTLRLDPFVTVAATTDPDRMPRPLRDRFIHQEVLDPYAEKDLALIAERTAQRLGRGITQEAARLLARVAHGIPRRLIALVRCARDIAVARPRHEIDERVAQEALAARGIDERGLDARHRRTLDVLRRHGRPLGRRRLAGQLGMSPRLFAEAVEPLLLELDLVLATPRGLVAAPSYSDRVAEGAPRGGAPASCIDFRRPSSYTFPARSHRRVAGD